MSLHPYLLVLRQGKKASSGVLVPLGRSSSEQALLTSGYGWTLRRSGLIIDNTALGLPFKHAT